MPPLIAVVPAASVPMLASEARFPTAPPKVVLLAFTARARAAIPSELRVSAKLTVAPVSVVSAPSRTASLKVSVAAFTTPPLMAVEPPASVVRLVRAVVPPTAPVSVVIPVLFNARLWAPLTVLPKLMLPLPALTAVVPARVAAPATVTLPLVVLRLPFRVAAVSL